MGYWNKKLKIESNFFENVIVSNYTLNNNLCTGENFKIS